MDGYTRVPANRRLHVCRLYRVSRVRVSHTRGSMSNRERRELEGSGSYQPEAALVDLEAQRRELEEAGWTPIERLGKLVWRRPDSNYLYPQGVAIRLVRETAEDESTESGGAT